MTYLNLSVVHVKSKFVFFVYFVFFLTYRLNKYISICVLIKIIVKLNLCCSAHLCCCVSSQYVRKGIFNKSHFDLGY